MSFEFQPCLAGEIVKLEPLQATQFEDLQATARHLDTWADYPNTAVQATGSIEGWFSMGLDAARALVILDAPSGRVIGTTRFYDIPDEADGIGIGFTFVDERFRRGGQTNTEMKRLMFRHAFSQVSTVWFHVLPGNLRSQTAVRKLGVTERGHQTLCLAGRPVDYATFSLSKTDWGGAGL